MSIERLWLSVREASQATGFSETTIRRGVAAGTIPVLRSLGDRGSIRVARTWAEGGQATATVLPCRAVSTQITATGPGDARSLLPCHPRRPRTAAQMTG